MEKVQASGHLKYAAGINTTVWSYDKLLNFTVYGCSRTLPDAELYTQRIQAAFEELRSATRGLADNRTDPPKPTRAAPTVVGGDARGR